MNFTESDSSNIFEHKSTCKKTRKAWYKYSPFTIITIENQSTLAANHMPSSSVIRRNHKVLANFKQTKLQKAKLIYSCCAEVASFSSHCCNALWDSRKIRARFGLLCCWLICYWRSTDCVVFVLFYLLLVLTLISLISLRIGFVLFWCFLFNSLSSFF